MIRILLLLLCFTAPVAYAHTPSNAFMDLALEDGKLEGTLLLRLEDVALFAPIDADQDHAVTWGEVKGARDAINAYVAANLAFSAGEDRCAWGAGPHQVEDMQSGRFLHIPVSGTCAAEADSLTADYDLLFALLPSHRAFLQVHASNTEYPALLSPSEKTVSLRFGESRPDSVLLLYVWEGIRHIWMGYDHIAFLLALILPLFLNRNAGSTDTTRTMRNIALDVLRVVTAFTLAHSITLILASAYGISLNLRLIEAIIAISVVLSGINMVYPIFSHTHWRMAFGFGLIHGFGFASVLRDLSLPDEQFLVGLLSFNVGVEVGQLIIVALLFPILLLCRKYAFYRRTFVPAMAVGVAGMGCLWTIERLAG